MYYIYGCMRQRNVNPFQYAKDIITQLINYVQKSDDAGIWMLSYILIPDGREDFSNRINKKVFLRKRSLMNRFVVSKKQKKEDIEELIDMSLDNVEILQEPIDYSNEFRVILNPKEIEDDENEEEEDNLPWELIEEEEEDDIMDLNKKAEKEDEEKEKKDEDEENDFIYDPSSENDADIEIEENHQNAVDENQHEDSEMEKRILIYPAQQFLEITFKNRGISPLSTQRTMNAFNSYVKSNIDLFKNQRLENGDYFWEDIKGATNPIWATIAEIAMRLHCSRCSEASCERTICMQRLVLTARRMSSKKDLLDARLTLIRGLNIDNE